MGEGSNAQRLPPVRAIYLLILPVLTLLLVYVPSHDIRNIHPFVVVNVSLVLLHHFPHACFVPVPLSFLRDFSMLTVVLLSQVCLVCQQGSLHSVSNAQSDLPPPRILVRNGAAA